MSSALRPLAVCADDFGLTPAISRGILRAAREGSVRSFSCLVTSPHWDASRALLGAAPEHEIGLHFGLTTCPGAPGARPVSLVGLLLEAMAGRLDRGWVRACLAWQWERLTEAIGRSPDFLDGHHHVHQFPGVAEEVAGFLAARAPGLPVRLDLPAGWPGWRMWVSDAVIRTSALRARPIFAAAGLRMNRRLHGFHGFTRPEPLAELWGRSVAETIAGDALATHPGEGPDPDLPALDSYRDLRAGELGLLTGAFGPRALAERGVRPVRLSEACSLPGESG